jgi:DNA-binding NarL/FixJ family response regulator
MQTILVVEDDRFALTLVVDGLQERFAGQAEVLGAISADAARRTLASRRISVMIIDMNLDDVPGAGFELIRLAKSRTPRTFILVNTAYADVQNVQHWIRAGAYAVLSKPTSLADLAGLVSKGLDLAAGDLDRDALNERLILEEYELVQRAASTREQGVSLENLCFLLFGSVPGWTRLESRLTLPAEEIDLVIANEASDEFWSKFGSVILVECKNWHRRRRPGRKDFDAFYMKLARRSPLDCRLGFFISFNGFARTFVEETSRLLDKPQKVALLDAGKLWELVVAADRSSLLKEWVRGAVIGTRSAAL